MATANDVPVTEDVAQVERDAEAVARAADPAHDARSWLLSTTSATLCTLSAKPELEGFPFGSVVPFALDAAGRPVIYTAGIAAHTANMRRDNRASLFVRQPDVDGDPQSGWRLTLVGEFVKLSLHDDDGATQVTQAEHDDVAARYFERVPSARSYLQTHDFSFWRMQTLKKVRYIAGFGKICWLRGDEVLRQDNAAFATGAQHAIDHMNDDHVENMKEMCRGVYGLSPERVRMVALDATGFDLDADAQRHRFSFGREVAASEVRHAIIEVLQKARASTGTGA